MDDNSLMTFGKYKGVKIANVPASYLIYIYENGRLYGDLKEYIEDNLEVLKEEVKRQNNK